MPIDVTKFKEYADMGISTIPCKKVWDEKDQRWTGKQPSGIEGWQRFSRELPTHEEIDRWRFLNNVWGIAVVCGPASNICCVDIDTEDKELQARIIAQLPYSPILIKGDPKRYGKLLYRISDDVIPDNYSMTKTKVIDPRTKKSIVDFFFSNSYVLIPMSFHSSDDKDQNTIWYTWGEHELTDTVLKNLPDLPPSTVDRVRMAVEGYSSSEIEAIVPNPLETEEVSGRWQQIVHLASAMIRSRTGFEIAVDKLLSFDQTQFPNCQYFMDKTKGNNTLSARVNAIKFYADMLQSVNRKKHNLEEIEIPEESFAVKETRGWAEVVPLKKRVDSGLFNPNWIPEIIRESIMEASVATSVDPASIFFYMLGTFSACLGNKVIIQPYQKNHEYTETSNLYVGIVAKSGERKSETTKIAKKPIMRLQKELQDKMKYIKKNGEVHNENIEIRIESIRSVIKKEIRENGVGSLLAVELHKEVEDLEKTKVEVRDISIYEQENTTEAYFKIVEQNSHGIFIEFNEWGAMYESLNMPENKKLRRFILDGWDGQHPFSYKTKHQGSNIIPHLNISIGFCAQEDIISGIFQRVVNFKKENDGLMQRFLLVLSDGKYRDITDCNLSLPPIIFDIFNKAYEMKPSTDRIRLDNSAYDLWMKFLRDNRKTKEGESNAFIESFFSKFDGMSIRIASNLAHLESRGEKIAYIAERHMKTAIEICLYLQANIKAIRTMAEQSTLYEIVRMMEVGIIEDDTLVRDLYRQHVNLFGGNVIVAMDRLKILNKHNYVRLIKEGKSWKININPKVKK